MVPTRNHWHLISLMFPAPNEQLSDLQSKAKDLFRLYPFELWHKKTHDYLNQASSVGETISISCSGGADSVFAALLVWSYFKGQINLIHVNHGIREKAALRDEGFVRMIGECLCCNTTILKIQSQDKTDEGSLRQARMNAVRAEVSKNHTRALIQGHQADDIAESLLWRISRGASPEGLTSPSPYKIYKGLVFLRPFLTFSRQDIRESLESFSIPWVDDETNFEPKYQRNRLRLNVTGLWKSSVDRDLLTGVQQTRDLVEEQNEAISEWVSRAYEQVIDEGGVRKKLFLDLPSAIKRGVLITWLASMKIEFSHKQLTEIIHISSSCPTTQKINLKGNGFIFIGDDLISVAKPMEKARSFPRCNLPEEGTVYLPSGAKLSLGMVCIESSDSLKNFKNKGIANKNAWINADAILPSSIYCRTRTEGDLYHKLGSSGAKSVKKVMIDHKIPHADRDAVPLIIVEKKGIAWIPGLPPSEKLKILPSTKRVMHLTYSPCVT